MRKIFFLILIIIFIVSCKKNKENEFANTKWQTYFKYEGFSFYAEKELQFNKDKTCIEIGLLDTVYGNWSNNDKEIKIDLDNKTRIKAIIISKDSLSGIKVSETGVAGEWLAKRK